MTNEEAKNLEENIKKHIDIVLEHMDDKFAVVYEGQKVLTDRVDILTEKVDLLVEDMDEVKTRLTNIEGEVKEVNVKLDKKADKDVADDHETRIVKLENTAFAKA
jgi:predicted ribosome quality control (RQC) complex YloA/Tae2 family protein